MDYNSIYLAGFFDGEGYVGLLKRTRGKYIEHFVSMSIGQKDGATMDWIKENFGGHVHRVKRDGSYQWIASNKNAYQILKQIVPYLKYKKPQAELAIKYFEERPTVRKISVEEMARRELIMNQLKESKKIFTKSTYVL